MKLRVAILAMLPVLAALAVAQTTDEPPPIIEASEDEAEQQQPGLAALNALRPPALELGVDLGNSCVCLCRQADPPRTQRWGHYERSIVSGCQWSGRICVVDGQLGSLGACTESPAPLG